MGFGDNWLKSLVYRWSRWSQGSTKGPDSVVWSTVVKESDDPGVRLVRIKALLALYI